jgi:spermidine/putrescine transport system permease protein
VTLRARGKGDARRWPGFGLVAGLFLVFVYLPIGILIALSFNDNQAATIWTGFSTRWYDVAFANDAMLTAAGHSLIIAVTASLVSTAMAIPAALAMAHRGLRGAIAANAMLALPLTVPEIVTAVATLIFFASLGFRLGLDTVIVAHTVFCIPFAYLPIRARLQGLDPALGEAAADLYATPWRAFRRVTLPLLWPGVLSGLALAFIISLDNFVITFFVGGAGSTTLPIYIFGLVRVGVSPEVNAISTLMIAVSILFVSVSVILGQRHR